MRTAEGSDPFRSAPPIPLPESTSPVQAENTGDMVGPGIPTQDLSDESLAPYRSELSGQPCFKNNILNKAEVQFYSFPRNPVQRDLWIRAVKRENDDGTLWTPKDHHRLCSLHFIGGKMSSDPDNPSYGPTIFPTDNFKVKASPDQRCQRRKAQSAAAVSSSSSDAQVDVEECQDDNP